MAQQGLLGHILQMEMTQKMPVPSWHILDLGLALNVQPMADHGSEEGKGHPAVYQTFVTQLQHRQALTQQGEITHSTVLLLEPPPPTMLAAWLRAVVRVRQGRDLMSQGSEQAAGAATIGFTMDTLSSLRVTASILSLGQRRTRQQEIPNASAQMAEQNPAMQLAAEAASEESGDDISCTICQLACNNHTTIMGADMPSPPSHSAH